MFFNKDPAIWSPHLHRAGPGSEHSTCIYEMEQNETGEPSDGCFLPLVSTASCQELQRPPESLLIYFFFSCRLVLLLCC